jgi:hypothetical protein
MNGQEVLYKGEKWTPLVDDQGKSVNHTGRHIFVRSGEQKQFQAIAQAAKRNFNQLYIQRQIVGLKSVGLFNSFFSKFSALDRMLPLEGGQLIYEIRGGDIYLKDILVDVNYRASKTARVASAGMYKAKRDRYNNWHVPNDEQVSYIDTKNAAINGFAANLADAAGYMSRFIERGFGDSALRDSYCLFYNPATGGMNGAWRSVRDSVGMYGGTQAARKLADVIELTAARGKEVNWTVHEQGHALFKHALRLLDGRGTRELGSQTVFYANPTVNLELGNL